jgi:uncharacterized protein (TIGR02611 family)
VVGGAVVLAGVLMMVLPGPGLLTIVLGLGILSLEFEIARVWLQRARAKAAELAARIRARGTKPPA